MMRKMLLICMNQVYKKIVVDPEISTAYLLGGFLHVGVGLLRGLFFYRRKIVIGRNSRVRCARKLTLMGGLTRIGDNCELDCLSKEGLTLGTSFKLGCNSKIICTGSIQNIGKGVKIGNHVGIGEYAFIGGAGGVIINDDCIIGQYFSVHPENHIFKSVDLPLKQHGTTRAGITIGKNCWIGAKVTILDGGNLGDDCVVAAGSVVRGEFPKNCIIAGVPAKVISYRS